LRFGNSVENSFMPPEMLQFCPIYVNIIQMKFEWDVAKNSANRLKHGIDFETAKDLWLDENRIEIQAPHPVENRHIIIAKLCDKLWTAVYTMRSNKVRIISARRSRKREADLYEKENTG
jgi:uncharacterized protein